MRYVVSLESDKKDKILSAAKNYDMIVVDAQDYTAAEIKQLKSGGATVLSYINVGAVESDRSYFSAAKSNGLLICEYDNWPDEYWVKAQSPKWGTQIATIANGLKEKGVDGYWVDNLDIYYMADEEWGWNSSAKAELFNSIKLILTDLHNKGYVMINGGDVFVSKALKLNVFDGINQETVFTSILDYDPPGEFGKQDSEERKYFTEYADEVSKAGKDVFFLEYTNDSALKAEAEKYCEKHGFSIFVSSTIELGSDIAVTSATTKRTDNMALRIVDVSEHQGKIDWEKVKPYIDGAIIRIGYGDDLKEQDDLYVAYNLKECKRLGIPYAVYIYSYATNGKQNKSEVAHTVRVVGSYEPESYWLDLEEWDVRANGKDAANLWNSSFKEGGVYAGQSWWKAPLKGVQSRIWCPAYGYNSGKPETKYKPALAMDGWQYTSKAVLPGISGNVDMSEWYVPFVNGSSVKSNAETKVKEEIIVTKKMVATEIMKHLCIHSGHGYTQDMAGRQGTGDETISVYGKDYIIKDGDRDCSSAVISAYEAAGISCNGATYTGNMKERMVASGNFKWRPMSFIAQAGDTYLNEKNHTAMCLSAEPDVLMEFSINEKGTTLGGKVGDQKQVGEYDETYGRGESHLALYYDYPWDGILECTNNEVAFVVGADGSITESGNVTGVEVEEPEAEPIKENTVINKSDNETAIEVMFDVYGSGDKRKAALGARWGNVQDCVDEYWGNMSQFLAATKSYLKKYGCDTLIK